MADTATHVRPHETASDGRAHETAGDARAHEPAGISGRRIVQVAALLAATLVAVVLAAGGVMGWLHHRTARAVAAPDARPAAMPSPPPQTAPSSDLSALRAAKARLLHEYRWLDRDHGIVRIPIERAMALLVERGGAVDGRNAMPQSEAKQ
ncbi:MAG TPA: hypothetical protein VJV77_11140 [Casimicrobiaceae bacterium]|nr:hypothetical protein [Casimicrobiaceae bacterium]